MNSNSQQDGVVFVLGFQRIWAVNLNLRRTLAEEDPRHGPSDPKFGPLGPPIRPSKDPRWRTQDPVFLKKIRNEKRGKIDQGFLGLFLKIRVKIFFRTAVQKSYRPAWDFAKIGFFSLFQKPIPFPTSNRFENILLPKLVVFRALEYCHFWKKIRVFLKKREPIPLPT